ADALLAELAARAEASLSASADPPTATAAMIQTTRTVQTTAATAAAAPPADAVAAPGEDDVMSTVGVAPALTAFNFPSELALFPSGGETRFAHATKPAANGANVELWHSRLIRRSVTGTLVE